MARPRLWSTCILRIKTSLAVTPGMQTWEAIYGNIVIHVQSCAEVQVKLSPKLFERRVLRIKTHVNSYFYVFHVWLPSGAPNGIGALYFTYQNAPLCKLRHANVGSHIWKHRISRGILHLGPNLDEPKAIDGLCFTYQNACQLIFLRVLHEIVTWCARGYGTAMFYISKRTTTQN